MKRSRYDSITSYRFNGRRGVVNETIQNESGGIIEKGETIIIHGKYIGNKSGFIITSEKGIEVPYVSYEKIDLLPKNRKYNLLEIEHIEWYSKKELYIYLRNKNYSHEIAKELSEMMHTDFNQSFRKGFEKGYMYGSGKSIDVKIISKEKNINGQ